MNAPEAQSKRVREEMMLLPTAYRTTRTGTVVITNTSEV
jgi:hypothetical protein